MKKLNNISILAQLMKEANGLGYSVQFIQSDSVVDWEDYSGYCNYIDKKIRISSRLFRKKRPKLQMAFILAHEIRHAIHFTKGLYKEVYDLGIDSGYAAEYLIEADCDRWATNRLKKLGVQCDFKQLMSIL